MSPYSGYNGQMRSSVYQPTELAIITKGTPNVSTDIYHSCFAYANPHAVTSRDLLQHMLCLIYVYHLYLTHMLSPSSRLRLQHQMDHSYSTSIPRASLASPSNQSGSTSPTQSDIGLNPNTNVWPVIINRLSIVSCIVLLRLLVYSWSSSLGLSPLIYLAITFLFLYNLSGNPVSCFFVQPVLTLFIFFPSLSTFSSFTLVVSGSVLKILFSFSSAFLGNFCLC